MKNICKSKTFQKGDDITEAIDFFYEHFEYEVIEVPGTNWGGGEPSPNDPDTLLKYKTIITITQVGDDEKS